MLGTGWCQATLRLPGGGVSSARGQGKAYNVHVNGVLHCRVRYRQLLGLHEQLRKEYGANVVPAFPPKKIFTLTPAEVEQRREQLEKYMQAVRQDPVLGGSETFNSFLRKAQQETQQIPTEEVPLEVLLSNGQKVTVTILTSDQTEDVLEVVMRKLQEFELPYVSVTSLRNPEYKIILRKSYWDSSYDDDVMEQRVGLNLLYAQTVSDIERGWILVTKEQHRQLKSLQEKVSKKEFIRLAQTLKYYGYLKFEPCVTDFPEKGCQVIVSAGNSELNFQVRLPSEQIKEGSFKFEPCVTDFPEKGCQVIVSAGNSELNFQVRLPSEQIKEGSFKVTRMRCWRVTSSMFRRRANGALRRSDSQQAVKSPPLLDSPDASREPMLKLSSKLTSVSLRGVSHSGSTSDLGTDDFHGNYAFEGIGDEDL
ncbi:Sorting nexin-17 [Chelonia mydas]|uniref:Sorting nexin-17 n=1 Tax=Chelonia mydas TaxID=8469 RepID=M7BL25_CHEMY|nr:Sorting nexin-17 [Chelonia mydas]